MNVRWVRLTRSSRLLAAGFLATAASGVFAVHRLPWLEIGFLGRPSLCAMKLVTGYPCLACRGTRAAFALAHGDWLGALRFNPLAVIFLAALGVSAAAAAFTGRLPAPVPLPGAWRALLWGLLLVTLLGNWAFVIAAGG